MSMMIAEVYDALKEAGASDEKARKAAVAVATHDQRSAAIEARLVALEAKVNVLGARLEAIAHELTIHRWVLGIIIALQVAILIKLFVH